jgi:DNA-binding transcriptional MocR family regulator
MIERTELLAQVASMYYEDNLNQDEIARRIDTSRSTVSRMLQEAREAGMVESAPGQGPTWAWPALRGDPAWIGSSGCPLHRKHTYR